MRQVMKVNRIKRCDSILMRLFTFQSIEYSGRGTFTAAANEFTADECITVSKGRRPYRPLLYIVITDGRSKDGGRISHVMEKIYKLNAVTFAIGVSK